MAIEVSMNLRITKLLFVPLLIALTAMAGCSGKPAVKVSLTPEQTFAAAKFSAETAADLLDARIASLKEHETENAEKIRILTSAKGVLDEFNLQVKDVVTVDLSNRETVHLAIEKALAGVDNLTTRDVLGLNDPAAQAYIKAGIAIARRAVKSFDGFLPAEGVK